MCEKHCNELVTGQGLVPPDQILFPIKSKSRAEKNKQVHYLSRAVKNLLAAFAEFKAKVVRKLRICGTGC